MEQIKPLKQKFSSWMAKIQEIIQFSTRSKVFTLLSILVIAAAIPITAIILQQQTNIQQHASYATCPSGSPKGSFCSPVSYCRTQSGYHIGPACSSGGEICCEPNPKPVNRYSCVGSSAANNVSPHNGYNNIDGRIAGYCASNQYCDPSANGTTNPSQLCKPLRVTCQNPDNILPKKNGYTYIPGSTAVRYCSSKEMCDESASSTDSPWPCTPKALFGVGGRSLSFHNPIFTNNNTAICITTADQLNTNNLYYENDSKIGLRSTNDNGKPCSDQFSGCSTFTPMGTGDGTAAGNNAVSIDTDAINTSDGKTPPAKDFCGLISWNSATRYHNVSFAETSCGLYKAPTVACAPGSSTTKPPSGSPPPPGGGGVTPPPGTNPKDTPPPGNQSHSFSDHLDGANCSTGISGWVCQSGYFDKANTVHLYADNTFDKGGKHLYPNTVANLPGNSGVSSACGGNAKHDFNFPASQLIHDGKEHNYYVYGIDLSGANHNPLLYPSPVKVTCSATNPSTSPSPSGSQKAISLHLVVGMPGLGPNGGNPAHTTRPVTVELYDATVKDPGASGTTPVKKATAVLKFDNGSDNNAGYFVSNNPVSFQNVPSGNYQILVKVPQALFVLAVNPLNSSNNHVFALTTDSTFNVPPVILYTGDIATENGGLNHLNINDYNTLISCFGDKADTSSCPVKTAGPGGTNLADLNDDGKVDGIDLNIFLRSFEALQSINAPGCEQFDCQGD